MKLLGGILLIIGTAIGGGMLALPIACAQLGFLWSSLLLLICWFIMTASAYLLLEINLWLPRHHNIISMAKTTLGKPGQCVAWIVYLLLLYSLLAAYIAGGSDFLKNIVLMAHITLPSWLAILLFTLLLGYVVFQGIQFIDFTNRILMFLKLSTFLLLIGMVFPHVSFVHLIGGQLSSALSSVTIIITSFGFATIIPSLRLYFQNDLKKLRLAILLGSLIPLLCYIAWDITIMGVIPREGKNGLIHMLLSNHSASAFINELSILLQHSSITLLANLFTSICLLTSFLGVALCLSDFLADGLQLEKKGGANWIIHGTALLPPFLIVLFYPNAFIAALSYAGLYTVILLILLPALMVWRGRYHLKIAQGYQVMGGKFLLIFLIASAGLIILYEISHLFAYAPLRDI